MNKLGTQGFKLIRQRRRSKRALRRQAKGVDEVEKLIKTILVSSFARVA